MKHFMPINFSTCEMNKIPTKLYLSKLFQEEIECLNSSITIKVTKPIANKISSSPLQRERNLQAQMVLQMIPSVSRNKMFSLIQIFLRAEKGQCYSVNSMRPV